MHPNVLQKRTAGFTLIELSIVLVIIGLIVGGVLVGQDLIKASEIRATVGQVEKYNSAVNTFRTKYNGIPGDITVPLATSFGLFSADTTGGAGHMDGNGLIEGGAAGTAASAAGETLEFWRHLSDANLIDGSFGSSATSAILSTGLVTGAVTSMDQSSPPTKLNPVQHFIVFSAGGLNYYEIMPITGVTTGGDYTYGTTGVSPIQAFNIDIKLDDGMPLTGIVQAQSTAVINATPSWVAGTTSNTCTMTGASPSDTNNTYNRVAASGGNDPSCAVRFRFN